MTESTVEFESTRSSKRRRGMAIVVAVAAGIGFAVPQAFASVTDNIVPIGSFDAHEACRKGSPGSQTKPRVCQTDNKDVSMYRQNSLSSAQKSRVADVISAQYQPTALVLKWDSSPSYSGGAETDFIYQIGSVEGSGDDIVGRAWCDDPIENTIKCDQTYIRIENGNVTKKRICHETGHAVGLLHGRDAVPRLSNTDSRLGCMETPSDGGTESIGSNNRDNINSVY
ncbi:hypothetical protein SALBM311S_05133 [Streptomyces alboniger]